MPATRCISSHTSKSTEISGCARPGVSAPRRDTTTAHRTIANSHYLSTVRRTEPRTVGGSHGGTVDRNCLRRPAPARRAPRRLGAAPAGPGVLARPRLLVALLAVYLPFFVVYFASPIAFSLPHAAGACHGQPSSTSAGATAEEGVADYLHGCGLAGRAAITATTGRRPRLPRAVRRGPDRRRSPCCSASVRLPERHWAHALVLLPAISAVADYRRTPGSAPFLSPIPGSRRSSPR